jgi:fructosamine-3-kinase
VWKAVRAQDTADNADVYAGSMSDWRPVVESVLGQRFARSAQLTGGCIADVWRVDLADGSRVVAKVAGHDGTLDVEGFMLGYLREHSRLPVPAVRHAEPRLLILEFIAGESRFSPAAERHAAELLAELHAVRGPHFGFERDTLIGPLPQPNPKSTSWIEFFRDHRLIAMSRRALESGHLPPSTHERVLQLAGSLGDLIDEPDHP